MRKKVKYYLGLVLVLVGFVLSSAQREGGSPAPILNLGAALVMCIGGKIMSNEMNQGEGE